MPQFDPSPFPAEIIWTLISFGLLFVLLKWLVLPRVTRAIEERARLIREEIEQAKRLREQAEQLKAKHAEKLANVDKEAKALLEQSELEARRQRQRLMAEWKGELERKKREFREEIEVAKNQALREIKEQAADFVVEATEKVIQQRIDAAQAQQAVDELLEELRRKHERGKPH